MRPILPPDLDLLARLLLTLPQDRQPAVLTGILAAADIGDRYRKRTGRAHPVHGDGSILSVALRLAPARAASFCDAAYCDSLARVIDGIRDWRARPGTHRRP